MELLAGILFHVDTLNLDFLLRAVFADDFQVAIFADWTELLGDLEAFWKVAIEVILAVEIKGMVDGHMESVSNADGVDDGLLIDHWHGARIGHI